MKTTRIEGQRLDIVLQRIREREAPSAVLDIESTEEFGREGVFDRLPMTSVEASLIDFIMPLISNPSIFYESNMILLLEYLRDDVLPSLDGNDELKELATKVVDEELDRHEFVREHRLASIAT
ncbi:MULTISPECIES: hypothetical protein [Rhodomicrobium]|uniref:hypothetical protein n=1 Tax=Rhodomicrobium TaxID=1068 RepID=UPI000F73A153|nr:MULTISPECIES: hypothetical protein [Rhodomicrobium]